jgi:hypothetical protein
MKKIKIADMKLTAEDMNQVKGGPAYLKIGDIKGESQETAGGDHKGWSDILSVRFTR